MAAQLKTIVVINSSDGQPTSVIVQNFISELRRKYPRSRLHPWPDTSGTKMIFTIKKTNLAVAVPDDDGPHLLPDLARFADAGCDIIVCACSARSVLAKAVEALPDKYDIIWTTNYETNERTRKILNKLYVQSIIRLLGEYHPSLRK